MAYKVFGVKPGARCPRCNFHNSLPDTYATYSGPITCRKCNCVFKVKFQTGFLSEPPRVLPPSDLDLSSPPVPGRIREDLLEAGVCFSIGAFKATTVLCRRALEAVMDDVGATGGTLRDKIKRLFDMGRIVEAVYQTSTEIRHFGNYGAHPSSDRLNKVSESTSKEVLYFTRDILDDLYVKPGTVRELQIRRGGEEEEEERRLDDFESAEKLSSRKVAER